MDRHLPDVMPPIVRDSLRDVIANDAHAATFQSIGQYRDALLQYIDNMAPRYRYAHPVAGSPAQAITGAVDAAMVEMADIRPPLRRSECERLIGAAFATKPVPPAAAEPMPAGDFLRITLTYEGKTVEQLIEGPKRPAHAAMQNIQWAAAKLWEQLGGKPIPAMPYPHRAETAAPTDISARLRNIANTTAHSALILSAADECERYYGGMMAWKQTAEKKDADWNAERMGRVNDRIAARATASNEIEAATADAARDVLAERRRQVEKEGYDPQHDDEHPCGEIAAYAAFYAMPPAARDWPAEETGYGATWGEAIIPDNWGPAKTGDRRHELVKAGALVLAEIERLDRAALKGQQ